MSRLLAGILAAVDFNNQSLLTTNKIYDIGSNRLLADKLGARERTSAQSIPQSVVSHDKQNLRHRVQSALGGQTWSPRANERAVDTTISIPLCWNPVAVGGR